MTPVEAVIAIRQRLVERGWCRGSIGGKAGPNCLYGAAEHAIPDTQWRRLWSETIALAIGVDIAADLRGCPSKGTGAIVWWNDSQASVEPVLAMLDRVIARIGGAS